MSASLKPLTVDEFLAWERAQPNRFEFDGIQPVAMTGGSLAACPGHYSADGRAWKSVSIRPARRLSPGAESPYATGGCAIRT